MTDAQLKDRIPILRGKTILDIVQEIENSPELKEFFLNHEIDTDQLNRVLTNLGEEQYRKQRFLKALLVLKYLQQLTNPVQ